MKALLAKWVERLGTKRVLALAIGPGIAGLGLDSALSHYAGKSMAAGNPAQLVPLAYGFTALFILGVVALPVVSANAFRFSLRLVALGSAGVGFAGVVFHLIPLAKNVSSAKVTLAAVEGALALAPPVFAPASFVAVGALLWMIASPVVHIHIRLGVVGRGAPRLRKVPTPLESRRSRASGM